MRADPAARRSDPEERYFSPEFARAEWEWTWTRVWHIGGRLAQLENAGDYIVHNFLQESFVMMRQEDGSVRAFYNSCQHRGNRLT